MSKNMAIASKTSKHRLDRRFEPYLWIAPALLLIVVFVYYPFLKTCFMSMTLVNSMGKPVEFVGMQNYQRVFADKAFIQSILNTLKYVIICVPLSLLISLTLAMLANKRRRLSRVYETMFTIPMAMSISVTVMIFQFMLNPTLGIINERQLPVWICWGMCR